MRKTLANVTATLVENECHTLLELEVWREGKRIVHATRIDEPHAQSVLRTSFKLLEAR